MSKLSQLEVSEICNQLGVLNPKNITTISGGSIHNAWKLDFNNYSFFVKKNIKKENFLKFEYSCLNDLAKYVNNQDLIIPKVNSYLNVEDAEILIMEWIEMSNGSQNKLGKGLAEMHLKSNEYNPKKFGYPLEGYIGLNNQPSGWEMNWIDCFANLRIKHQLKSFKNNSLNSDIKKNLISKIKLVLSKHIPIISLVHGDLWSGNVGINKSNKGVIFDPACWWADSEVDIAMSYLFGGFQREFYREYFKAIPKQKGFEERIIIYNLYHVLNHANMFGGSYVRQSNEYIKLIMNM